MAAPQVQSLGADICFLRHKVPEVFAIWRGRTSGHGAEAFACGDRAQDVLHELGDDGQDFLPCRRSHTEPDIMKAFQSVIRQHRRLGAGGSVVKQERRSLSIRVRGLPV